MTTSTAGVNPGSAPNSDSNRRSHSSWSPGIKNNKIKLSTYKPFIDTYVAAHNLATKKHTKFIVLWVSVQFP